MVALSLQRAFQCGEDLDMKRKDAEMGPRLSLDSFVPRRLGVCSSKMSHRGQHNVF